MLLKTVGEVLQAATTYLENRKVERPRRMAEELLAHALRIKRIDLYLQFDRPVVEEELSLMRESIKRLSGGEPLEYITGLVVFYGCKISVDKRVLIPRPETEILVDHIVKRIGKPKSAWDLCSGSGCIGIALKKKFPSIAVTLSDLSADALVLAEESARSNNVQVELLKGDLLEPFFGKKTDLITVNPPYISTSEYFSLDPSVRDYEPKLALVAGVGGGEFYERLKNELPSYLHPGAQVFMEIGESQGQFVKDLFSSTGWTRQELVSDWSGKDRFFFLEKQ